METKTEVQNPEDQENEPSKYSEVERGFFVRREINLIVQLAVARSVKRIEASQDEEENLLTFLELGQAILYRQENGQFREATQKELGDAFSAQALVALIQKYIGEDIKTDALSAPKKRTRAAQAA